MNTTLDPTTIAVLARQLYDARKARAHIYGKGLHGNGLSSTDPDAQGQTVESVDPPDGPMPALAWLDELLALVPGDAGRVRTAGRGRTGGD